MTFNDLQRIWEDMYLSRYMREVSRQERGAKLKAEQDALRKRIENLLQEVLFEIEDAKSCAIEIPKAPELKELIEAAIKIMAYRSA